MPILGYEFEVWCLKIILKLKIHLLYQKQKMLVLFNAMVVYWWTSEPGKLTN